MANYALSNPLIGSVYVKRKMRDKLFSLIEKVLYADEVPAGCNLFQISLPGQVIYTEQLRRRFQAWSEIGQQAYEAVRCGDPSVLAMKSSNTEALNLS